MSHHIRCCVVFGVLAALALSSLPALDNRPVIAQSNAPEVTANPRVERWILKQVTTGKDANLDQCFKDGECAKEEDRVLRASFIKELLTNTVTNTKVHRYGVRIISAVVKEPVDLTNEFVSYAISLEKCYFEDSVTFKNAQIAGDFSIAGSHFAGQTIFKSASVTKNFEAADTQFNDARNEAIFEGMKAGGNVSFHGSVFKGPANFDYIQVGGNMHFPDSTFEGPANFVSAEIKKDLYARGAQFKSTEAKVNFFSLKVEGNAVFSKALFAGKTLFNKADIGGNLEFEKTRFTKPNVEKNFNGIKADIIILDHISIEPPYWLKGLTYRIITKEESADSLIALIDNSEYSPEVYANIESFYRRQGNTDAAKRVHYALEWREGKMMRASRRPIKYLWNWLQWVTSGYGQYLGIALIWSAVFIIIGCIVFWREDGMEIAKAEDRERYRGRYHPIWYSLALFLPIIDLHDSKVWTPKMERRKARLYMRFHIILGYLLIPIGLAAWTGIIK